MGAKIGTVALSATSLGHKAGEMKRRLSHLPIQQPSSGFAGFRFPPEVILLAVRRYLRFGLSYRDLAELLVSAPVLKIAMPEGQCMAAPNVHAANAFSLEPHPA